MFVIVNMCFVLGPILVCCRQRAALSLIESSSRFFRQEELALSM